MACYPQDALSLDYITYPVGPAASGTLITAGSANTKGTYSQFVASMTFAAEAVEVTSQAGTTNGARYLVDVAIGAAASEVVKIPDLMVDRNQSGSANSVVPVFILPWAVPAASRLALRIQSSTGSSQLELAITLYATGGVPGIATFTSHGPDASDSGGLVVDPGGTANTKGAYVEFDASTAAIIQWLLLMHHEQGNTATSSCRWAMDVATGAASSEVVLIPDLRCAVGGSPQVQGPNSHPFMTYIAASTRLAIRDSCSINNATDRLMDFGLVVGTAPSEPALVQVHAAGTIRRS